MDAKWIHGLSQEMRVADAARKVLSARLNAVRYWLPLVAHADKDIEFVHQLRVTTRRAGAALKLFRSCFRHKAYRHAKQLLRELRQTAGEARDWDVFLETLFDEGIPPSPLRDFLFGFAASRRMVAQTALSKMAFDRRQPLDSLSDELDQLLAEPDEGEIQGYGELCLHVVRERLAELHRATHPVPLDYHSLHQIRILGKKLRYVLELSVDCFTPAAKESLLPRIESLQEILGEANDAHVLSGRLEEISFFARKFRPAEYPLIQTDLESLQNEQQRKLESEKKRFLNWLSDWDEAGPMVFTRSASMIG